MESNKSYRILNLQGAWLNLQESNDKKEFCFSTTEDRKYKDKDGKEIIIKADKNKLYSATMPYSLETVRAFNLLPKEVWEDEGELFTKLFVNFKFTKNVIDDDEADDKKIKIHKKKLRKLIYTSTVKIDDIEYCFFKRGASKARTANVIFVKKEHKDKLYNPCLLGLKFIEGEEYDITSKEAYTSLIMSGIIGTIEINSEEILIINDLMSPSFKTKQTVTKIDNDGNIYQEDGEFDVINNMTDGQALMDESVYIENELLHTATCALLRNDFLKANACRTRLQEYYKQNNITKVWDKFRGWMDADKIKLAITPSACKYLKFADQFKSEKDCFMDWLERIPTTFGVVKIDHVGNYYYSNRLSYQMLNSMNLSKLEVFELMQDELKYFKFLKDNTLATSQDIRKMTKNNKEINRAMRNEMSHFIDLIKNNKGEELSTGDMISDLLKRNSDFRLTKKFKDWKNEQLQDYIANLRLGKVRIKNSIYAIMISCPYEMLLATTTKNNQIDGCIMDGWECYCPTFSENENLIAIRNPQINAGNIACLNNKYHDEYKWFGYYVDDKARHDFVVFVNSYNCDIMNRLQGCDWDIDSCYLSNQKLLVSKALESQSWSTPTNGIKGNNNKRILDNNTLADIDNYLGGSTMNIGKIVNKSAIFNAYMYNAINNNYSKDYIKACYNASSTLSSFSQIAIDMAKKNFEGLSLTKEMNKLNYTCYDDNKQLLQFNIVDVVDKKTGETKAEKHMIVPYFFKYVAKDNSYREFKRMDCGMDYLEEIIDELDTKALQTDKTEIKDLIIMQKELDGRAYNREKMDNVRKVMDNCQSVLNRNMYSTTDSGEETREKSNFRKWAKREAIKKLKELELNEKTIYRILIRAFDLDKEYKEKDIFKLDKKGEKIFYKDKDGHKKALKVRELKEMTMLALTLIYNAYPESFLKCFKEKKMGKIKVNRFWM